MTYESGGVADELAEDISPARQSIRDRIRAQRDELSQDITLDLLVPGYQDLAIRYRGISDTEMMKLGKKINRSKDGVKAGYDFLAEACECVLVRPEDGADLEPLEDDAGDAIRFDARLAEFLGLETTSVRATIAELFSPGGAQTMAHMEHATSVQAWMAGKQEDVDPVLLGE